MCDGFGKVKSRQGGSNLPIPAVISSRMLYVGRVVSLRVDEIRLANGQTATREVVEHPGAVVVAALDSEGSVCLARQYRHAIGEYLLELPAGGLEKGEEPLPAAKRELREEIGVEAATWTCLGSFFSSPGYANERLYAFLATDLSPSKADPDDDEDILVEHCPLAELLDNPDRTPDAKSLATLLLVRRALEKVDQEYRGG